MTRILGAITAIVGIAVFLCFHHLIAIPAMTPKPNGDYGEMYGPVSGLRFFIYGACIILTVFGLFVALRRPR